MTENNMSESDMALTYLKARAYGQEDAGIENEQFFIAKRLLGYS